MSRRIAPAAVAILLTAGAARAQTPSPTMEELLQRAQAQAGTTDTSNLPTTAVQDMASRPVLAGPIDPATYRLGPGDRLVVQWSGRVTRSEFADVGPAGDVFLSEIGTLSVSGQTLDVARATILDRLRRVTRDVRVEVQLARPRTFRVYLGGAVDDPGPTEAAGNSRASDVVRVSALQSGASRRNLRVLHRDGSEERADLERLYRLGDHSHDAWLRDGDAIVVPWATEFVTMTGAVAAPGQLERAPGDSASTLLRMVGGPLPAAAPDDVVWIHWAGGAVPETLRCSLADLGPGGRKDGPLAHGDQIFVGFVPDYRVGGIVEVRGQVAKPGTFPVKSGGTHVSEVIAAAGGLLPSADSSFILLKRRTPERAAEDKDLAAKLEAVQRDLTVSEYEALQAHMASQSGEIRVDWAGVRRTPKALDLLLRDGDVLTVERHVATVRVDGQVMHPGILTYEPGLSVEKYIKLAGGRTGRAWGNHEQVTRAGSGHTLLAHDVKAVSPGDFIWIPTRPDVPLSRTTGSFLTAMAQIATVIIAIRSLK
jgi:protein involved in polysaccharide export with SLBB domain